MSRVPLIESFVWSHKIGPASLKDAGVKSGVDPTKIGVGRNPTALRKLSQELSMNFVTAAGFYRNKFHPPEVEQMSTEAIEERMYEEITTGISGTDIRAGVMGELGTTEDTSL